MSEGIEIKNLVKRFRKDVVLDNISLNIEPQKIYGLLGRNGAGKSTLMNIIADRKFSNSGSITLDGSLIHDNDDNLSRIYLTSEIDVYPDKFKIKDLFHWVSDIYINFDNDLCKKLSDDFKLNLNSKFGNLSTGYNSIVKAIIALCVPADYIFLDEPILGLDAKNRDVFYNALIQTYSDRPRTFVISTHIIEEIANIISNVVVIKDSKVLIDDSTENILESSYEVTGPASEVDAYTDGLNVIGSDSLGKIKSNYVFGELNDKPIPDTVTIANIDLQKLFVNLTDKE
ncbi:ATP-binding cassette domain-containing protein [Apilactobacillus ozensis]|uniref:ATP-binding cassette domain-containing protein n=1 Tax=Apilactobacillus ozensis TaxID=866801 RepID=UPI00200B6B31|nr:ABC transporter ATP-binding protein [Apilactobacillus ozensis]MCK8606947.1 ABC transporter ATP-binding protein [Apilactobacillus ozensis]